MYRRHWTTALAFLVPLLAGSGAAGALPAQVVLGTAVDHGGQRPIAGAFVLLLDPSGAEVARGLTTAAGTFRLRAPQPGRYRLRLQRIGFDDSDTEEFSMAAGETISRRMEVVERPIELTALKVDGGDARCGMPTDQVIELERVWKEAKKALEATAWTERRAGFVFDVARVRETLDPDGVPVEVLGYERQRSRGRHPFRAVDPDALVDVGWVVETDAGYQYFGPDAGVLIDTSFLDTHCFRLVGSKDGDRQLVGLAFEPAPRRDLPDIAGVLWLDAETAEMQSVSFRYEKLPLPVKSKMLGGEITFDQLPGGGWIVRSWAIRTPLAEVQRASAEYRRRVRLTGMYAETWFVLAAWERHHARPQEPPLVSYPVPKVVARMEEQAH